MIDLTSLTPEESDAARKGVEDYRLTQRAKAFSSSVMAGAKPKLHSWSGPMLGTCRECGQRYNAFRMYQGSCPGRGRTKRLGVTSVGRP